MTARPRPAYCVPPWRLTARCGEPFTRPWPGRREVRAAQPPPTDVAIRRLAALLPETLRGLCVEQSSGTPLPDGTRA